MRNLTLNLNKTKAILVGVGDYISLPKIQPAINNIDDITDLLVDKNILGLPPENICTIKNKRNDEIIDTILEFLDDNDNIDLETLIFYYVGHGIRNTRDKELYLTGTNSKADRIDYTAIKYTTIKERIENSQIQQRFIIIDACYSGLATMDVDHEFITEVERNIKGSYTLTSSASAEKASFDSNSRNTFFTEQLNKVIKNGLSVKEPFISWENIYDYLQKNVKQSTPQRKNNLNTTEFYFFRNAKYDHLKILEEEGDALFDKGEYKEAIFKYYEVFNKNAVSDIQLKIDKCQQFLNVASVLEKQRLEKEKLQIRQIEKENIEKELWDVACKINTIESFQNYLANAKGQIYKEEANSRVKRILANQQLEKENTEKDLWDAACKINTIESFQNYLSGTTSQKYKKEANSRVKKLQDDAVQVVYEKEIRRGESLMAQKKYRDALACLEDLIELFNSKQQQNNAIFHIVSNKYNECKKLLEAQSAKPAVKKAGSIVHDPSKRYGLIIIIVAFVVIFSVSLFFYWSTIVSVTPYVNTSMTKPLPKDTVTIAVPSANSNSNHQTDTVVTNSTSTPSSAEIKNSLQNKNKKKHPERAAKGPTKGAMIVD